MNEFITSKCTTQRFQVKQEVNSEFDFEDVNVDLKLSFLKLIYGTCNWLVEVVKPKNCVLLKKREIKVIQTTNLQKIAKIKCCEIRESQNLQINVSRKFHVIRFFFLIQGGQGLLQFLIHLHLRGNFVPVVHLAVWLLSGMTYIR